MKSQFINNRNNNQRGAALIVGVIFLIILTLFVLGAMRDVLLQEKMAGAYRNMSQAQTTADSVLRNAESSVYSQYVTSGILPTYFVIDNEQAGVPAALKSFRSGAGYVVATATVPNASQAALPSKQFSDSAYANSTLAERGAFVVEGPIAITDESGLKALEVHNEGGATTYVGAVDMYRITARATGGSAEFVRAAESSILITH